MTDDASVPAVALLFADADLSAHLREALQGSGARIVHEGAPADVTRADLERSGADVVIVNLDESDDDQVDHLYDVIDEDRQRVIFNDAVASRALSGWDRARWARHLAVKLTGRGDVDPPRPAAAAVVEVVSADEAAFPQSTVIIDEVSIEAVSMPMSDAPVATDDQGDEPDYLADAEVAKPGQGDQPGQSLHMPMSDVPEEAAHAESGPDSSGSDEAWLVDDDLSGMDVAKADVAAESSPPGEDAAAPPTSDLDMSLNADEEAEIAAMTQMWEENAAADAAIASDDGEEDAAAPGADDELASLMQTFDDASTSGPASRFADDTTQPVDLGQATSADGSGAIEPASAGDQPVQATTADDIAVDPSDAMEFTLEEVSAPVPMPEVDAQAASDTPPDSPAALESIIERQTESSLPPVADWDLVDFDSLPADPPPKPADREDAKVFGVEKVHAADYLSPHADDGESPIVPGMTLELVSLEESLAVGAHGGDDRSDFAHEMFLDASSSAIRRLVVLASAPEGAGAVLEVVSALTPPLPALLVLVQHHQPGETDALVANLKTGSRLEVRAMEDGLRARTGELLVLPAGHRCQIARDGRVQMQAVGARDNNDPSIDDCLISACSTFGSDLRAVIFAGDTNDALAGAQAVYDRRGQIWVQDPKTCTVNAMVTMAIEDGVVEFVGSPSALAKRLQEVFA